MLQKCKRRLQLLSSVFFTLFSSLQCSFLAYFERLWQRAMELQSFVLHEFELPKAFPWTIYSSPSFLNCFGDQKAIKTPKLNTIWLELIARVLNMLIGLKDNNYYSKVFKRVNYKLWNSTFWVVITWLLFNLVIKIKCNLLHFLGIPSVFDLFTILDLYLIFLGHVQGGLSRFDFLFH